MTTNHYQLLEVKLVEEFRTKLNSYISKDVRGIKFKKIPWFSLCTGQNKLLWEAHTYKLLASNLEDGGFELLFGQ